MTDDNSNPLRAVFLAALMVLWVFAGTVAFAGSAAAVSDGNLDNTQVNAIGDDSTDATTTYNISTSFDNTSTTPQSGVAAVELDFSDADQFGGNVDNFSDASDVVVTIEDGGTSRTVALQDTFTEDGDTIGLDFQNKEDVSDDATLYVNFTDNVITNPGIGDTYEVQFRSFTDAGTSGEHKAANASYTISGDGTTDDERETDAPFEGGSVVWKGQILDFQAMPNTCNAIQGSYKLRYYDTDQPDNIGTLIREISLNDSAGAQIPTKNVADNEIVVITARNDSDPNDEEQIVDVGSGGQATAGHQTSNCFAPFSSSDVDDTVEVVPQTIEANFSEDQVRQDENATLEVDSNRNGYDLYVSSEDFSQTELSRIVNNSDTSDINTDRAPSDESVRVNGINSSAEIDFDFGGESTGNYSFTVSPTDTTPSDTAEIEVVDELAGNGEFDSESGAFSVKRGDIQSPQGDDDATISVRNVNDVDFVTIVIGNEDRNNYEVAVTAEPNDDGRIDIRMNTFLAGILNASNESRAFEATNGEVVNVNRRSDKLTGVLDEGQYDLTLQSTDGEDFDRGVLNVRRSQYNSLTQHRHPDTSLGALDEKGDLVNNSDLSETNRVTLADRDRSDQRDILVHKVDISGIYGALDAVAENDLDEANGNEVLADIQTNGTEELGAAEGEVLNVSLVQINEKQNREPKFAGYEDGDIDSDEFRFVIDEDNETLYLVTDVRDLELSRVTGDDVEDEVVEPGDDFEFEFDVGPGYENAYEGGIDEYVPEGTDTVTQFDVEDREAEFDPQGADRIQVNNEANVTLSGETNIAPGTEVTIQVDSSSRTRRANDTETGDLTPIFARDTVEVSEDGTFSSDVFDFSENEVNRTFVVTSPGNGFEDAAEKPGVVVEGEPATVALSDITVPADQDELSTITVDSAFLPRGGFVTIHDGTLNDGATLDSVRGTSAYLEEGEHSDIEVSLDSPYSESGTAIAMPHKDTNGNEEYDFVTSEGEDDAPYTAGGEIVVASASVTFETPTPTPTASPTPTDEPDTATATPTETEDQPGFGAALALIALIGAALLAARRRDF